VTLVGLLLTYIFVETLFRVLRRLQAGAVAHEQDIQTMHAVMQERERLSRELHDGVAQLVARLRLEKSTVSRLVHQMEQRGWIARRRSSLDGRMAQIHLTDAGRTLTRDLAEARRAKLARILAAIPEEQRARVLESLTILVEAMREQH
jgi:DNA-binding MarR family transcriptional regulator